MKIVYIAHPVGGDVKNNIDKILKICREINLNESDRVPFVPYLSDLMSLDDNVPAERQRGIKNGVHILQSGLVEELRLYGDRISSGMQAEIDLVESLGIPVIAMTPEIYKLRFKDKI